MKDPEDITLEARHEIERAVSRILAAYPIERCDIRACYERLLGEEIIEVLLSWRFSDLPVDSEKTVELASEVRDILVRHGDWRVPYLEHRFAKGQAMKSARTLTSAERAS